MNHDEEREDFDPPVTITLMTPTGVCEHDIHQVVRSLGNIVGATVDVEDLGTVLLFLREAADAEDRINRSIELLEVSLQMLKLMREMKEEEEENDNGTL